MKTLIAIALAGAGASGIALPASAQEASQRILDTFGACRQVQGTDARLACFEHAYDSFADQVKTKSVRIVDKKDVVKARRSLFGFTLPNIDLFGGKNDADAKGRAKGDEEPEVTSIDSTIASIREVDNGRVEIRLAEESGAVWRSTDPVPFPPKPGDKIHIKRGALGNYFMSVGSTRFRGMRLR